MTDLDDLIQAQIDGTAISYADLHRLDFKSGEVRLHMGFGPFIDGNGERWEGIGNLGAVGAVSAGPGQAIEELTYALAGDTNTIANIEADTEETAGQESFRYLQFRRLDTLQPIGEPIQIYWGKMGAPSINRPRVDASNRGTASRSTAVSSLNAFVNRRKPSYGFLSHRDQLARTDGTDNIFINVSRMANATAPWPHGLS